MRPIDLIRECRSIDDLIFVIKAEWKYYKVCKSLKKVTRPPKTQER